MTDFSVNPPEDRTTLVQPPGVSGTVALDWQPPADRLPGKYAALKIRNCRPKKSTDDRQAEPDYVGSQVIVYHGYDEQRREPVVLQFQLGLHVPQGSTDRCDCRYVIDLQSPEAGGSSSDWPAAVVVTRLGALLEVGRRGRSPDDPGDVQESFIIEDFLGMGGFGEVWAAIDRNEPDPQRRRVALKFLTTEGQSISFGVGVSPEDSALIPAERLITDVAESAEAAQGQLLTRETQRKGLENFIIPFRREFDFVLDNNEPCWPRKVLVMDRAAGSMEDVISQFSQPEGPRLPDEMVSRICRRLILTLRALHSLHWGHRDLKPGNVLLTFVDGRTWDGQAASLDQAAIVLGDVATMLKADTVPEVGMQLHQDGFKAPELFLKSENGDITPLHDEQYATHPAEDLYALGCVFERLATCLEGNGEWLTSQAERLKHPDPAQRPRPTRQLAMNVSPRWQVISQLLSQSGWKIARPDYHQLVGREWVRDVFEEFCREQTAHGRGGVFLLTAEPGVGKTAILTHWNATAGLGSGGNAANTSGKFIGREGDDVGLHPAFYFQFGHGDSVHSALIPALATQLSSAPYEVPLPEGRHIRELSEFELREMLQQAAKALTPSDPLVIILDGLDEADDPVQAVSFVQQLCRNGLPPHVFLLLSSRPRDPAGRSHLDPFKSLQEIVRSFVLETEDPRNLADAEKFWIGESRRLFNEEDVEAAREHAAQIVQKNKGIFFILRSALDEIAAGRLSLDDFREQDKCPTVVAWHAQQWTRLERSVGDDSTLKARLRRFATALSAIREPVDDALFAKWLKLDAEDTELVRQRLSWLMNGLRGETANGHPVILWQRKHKSVLDFLTAPPVEDTDTGELATGPAYSGLRPMHQRIATSFIDQAKQDAEADLEWSWHNIEDYGLRHVVAHLLACSGPAGEERRNFDQATTLLRDQLFLDIRLNHHNPH